MDHSRAVAGLIAHLWQSTFFALAAGAMTVAFRGKQARVRYWFWFGASFKFFLPFAVLMSLGSRLASVPSIHRIAATIQAPAFAFIARETTPTLSVPALAGRVDWVSLAVAAWACGFAANVAMRLRGWLRIRHIVHSAVPVVLDGVDSGVDVRRSPGLVEPAVVGFLRTILLVPEGLAGNLTPAQFQAVIAHEMCHVRHRDNLLAAIHMAVEALFWFHPLVWWIGARMIEERERACDEEVLRLFGEPSAYAEGILRICRLYVESPLVCVSGVTGGSLRRRIEEIMSNRAIRRLSPANKILIAGAAAAALALPLTIGIGHAVAEEIPAALASPVPQFDFVSVKPSAPGQLPYENFPLGTGDVYAANNGYLSARGEPLSRYFFFAYKIMNNQRLSLMPKLPAWMNREHFDVEARAEGTPTKDEMRLMMRSLLADRFQLAVRTGTQDVPALAFVLRAPGQTGPRLQPHPAGEPCPTDAPPDQTVAGGFPRVCGGVLFMRPDTPGFRRMGGRNVTIEFLAQTASTQAGLGKPMVDRTGLGGTFDFTVEWDPRAAPPAFEEALRDQLGIRLEPRNAPLQVFVLDHVEHPAEN